MASEGTLTRPGAKLLVVDDSPTVLRVMEAILTQAGYEVACLDSGAGAVALARAVKPDIIFVDFAMPQLNGYAVCRALGMDSDVDGIPIVLMSTRGDPVGERFVREMGIVDHITKPFAPEALLALVQHILRKARAEGGARHRDMIAGAAPAPGGGSELPEQASRRELTDRLAEALRGLAEPEPLRAALEKALAAPEVIEALARAAEPEPGVALSGELAAVSIAEVLQVLSLQRQSGFLTVRHDGAVISIAFKDGQVRLVTGLNMPRDLLLGSILVQEGLMSEEELGLLITNRRGSRRRIGGQVVRLGYVTQEQLHRALRRQSSELMYEMLRWGRGRFAFRPARELPADVLEFEFGASIDELLMEGFRRVDEWGLIEGAIPRFDAVLTRVPGGLEHLGPQSLTQEELAVLEAVDGRSTVHEVIRKVGTGTFEVAHVLYRLVSARVLAAAGATSAEEAHAPDCPS